MLPAYYFVFVDIRRQDAQAYYLHSGERFFKSEVIKKGGEYYPLAGQIVAREHLRLSKRHFIEWGHKGAKLVHRPFEIAPQKAEVLHDLREAE